MAGPVSHNLWSRVQGWLILQDYEEARTKQLCYYKYMVSSWNQPTSPRVEIERQGKRWTTMTAPAINQPPSLHILTAGPYTPPDVLHKSPAALLVNQDSSV
jgi:hypothetical protein